MPLFTTRLPAKRSRARKKVRRRLIGGGLASVVSLLLIGANPPPQVEGPASPTPTGSAPEATSQMDEPLRLIVKARKAYQAVKDYSCVLVKREQISGRLQPENVIAMKIRTAPFSVALDWMAPRELVGQEAAYVAGTNKGQMRVHPKGVAGLVGWMSVDVRDPRVMEHSRHLITEAGLGNMIERYAASFEADKKDPRVKVTVADFDYDKRHCTRIEVIRPDARQGGPVFYRALVYFDKETHLPIRTECYDRPRVAGSDGELVEMYSFTNLRLNVGLGDETFKR
jgi:hypothetical protein